MFGRGKMGGGGLMEGRECLGGVRWKGEGIDGGRVCLGREGGIGGGEGVFGVGSLRGRVYDRRGRGLMGGRVCLGRR